MDTLDFTRSAALNNIPKRKLEKALVNVDSLGLCLQDSATYKTAINRYAESNIPIEYWTLRMDKNFVGDPKLKQKFEEYIADLNKSYADGISICFAGGHGLGKTMTTTCILKEAAKKGYSCLYTTISDVVSILTSNNWDDKFLTKRELTLVDFLVVDEVDQRFFKQSDAANETFARTLEFILRTRMQNKLPTLLATNSPQIKETFITLFKDSIGSLMSKIETFSVMPGPDFRKTQ